MIISSPQGSPWLVLVILCMFSDLLNAYDLSSKRKPQGPLGVALDYSLATAWPLTPPPNKQQTRRNWMWSSHITFASPVSAISDSQLWQIARDAYKEIAADMNQYEILERNTPGAMTVLAYGNEIILASSQKGQSSFTYTYESTPVLETLKICQTVWRDDGPGGGTTDVAHRTQGKCGEPMSAHLYYSLHTTPLAQQHPRVGTVTVLKGTIIRIENTSPCGDPQNDIWGCNLFVAGEGMTELDINLKPAPYTLSTLAGGPVIIDQIQLCSAVKVTTQN